MPVLNAPGLIADRVASICHYQDEAGTQYAELDVSGGIDSAVMLMLLVQAQGPERVTAVYSNIHSSEESYRRARLVADRAGIELVTMDLSEIYDRVHVEAMRALRKAGYDMDLVKKRLAEDPTVQGSFRSCLRAPVGRYLNRLTGGGIRHGTGNEDEDRWLRFYQKGGDGEVDTNPLAMLSKGEVYQLACYLDVPKEIIQATPTPDLWGVGDTHNDEEELSRISGVSWTYSRVDPETAEYTQVGTIERMSRLFDESDAVGTPYEALLPKYGLTTEHLRSALAWERATRHKANPNCPTLGSRNGMVGDNLLTNELPQIW